MSWFTPKCPINIEDKVWLEESFQWLIDEFGAESLRESPADFLRTIMRGG